VRSRALSESARRDGHRTAVIGTFEMRIRLSSTLRLNIDVIA
jgi:hypothetical protein